MDVLVFIKNILIKKDGCRWQPSFLIAERNTGKFDQELFSY